MFRMTLSNGVMRIKEVKERQHPIRREVYDERTCKRLAEINRELDEIFNHAETPTMERIPKKLKFD